MDSIKELQENLWRIQDKIADAARKSGRLPQDIQLLAVTKTIDPERIRALLSLGDFELGENKVQELLSKQGVITPEPSWHLIGHLQTNKVKYIVDKVKLIQSVDSIKLAEEIDKRAGQKSIKSNILIEINIGNETTKQGIKPNQLQSFIEQLFSFSNICIKGLMCVAPFVKKPEDNRVLYEKMYNLLVEIKKEFIYNTDKLQLSMGMTNDFAEAIQEGATMVRIGTALFGSRT